jgi:hypothetical protein
LNSFQKNASGVDQHERLSFFAHMARGKWRAAEKLIQETQARGVDVSSWRSLRDQTALGALAERWACDPKMTVAQLREVSAMLVERGLGGGAPEAQAWMIDRAKRMCGPFNSGKALVSKDLSGDDVYEQALAEAFSGLRWVNSQSMRNALRQVVDFALSLESVGLPLHFGDMRFGLAHVALMLAGLGDTKSRDALELASRGRGPVEAWNGEGPLGFGLCLSHGGESVRAALDFLELSQEAGWGPKAPSRPRL